ncbi:hypothetical protein TNCV_3944371, partial [Trichonephila clavipes]
DRIVPPSGGRKGMLKREHRTIESKEVTTPGFRPLASEKTLSPRSRRGLRIYFN